ncbi:nitrate reductase [Campylobacter sp. RM16190]|uniref:WD40 repeat domain-containing protein n=1 Tax=Campylobacter sp. RM16190 TaxID=1705727 RepID=UPI00147517F9|nr:nitrate reductase [Campylobacter sp. RM16190]
MKILLAFLALLNLAFSLDIKEPYKIIEAHSNVISSSLINDKLYLGTDSGQVNIYDMKSEEFLEPIVLPKIKTHFTDDEFAKVFSIDELNGVLMVLSETSYGKRLLHVYEMIDGKRVETKTINLNNESIKKALFLDPKTAIIGSLSNEIYFLNLETGNIDFSKKFSIASLSDFELSEDRSKIAVGCESGIVYIFDAKERKVLNELGFHKDNMYDIEYKNGAIVTGGVDRHAGVYSGGSIGMMRSNFLVYAVGLSDDGKLGAFMSDDLSDIDVFEVNSKRILARLKTMQSTISGIHFLDDSSLISVAYEKKVKFWRFR